LRVGEHLLDLLVEGEAVGQPGQCVAQHLRAQATLGLDLGGFVDQRDHAAHRLARQQGETGEADGEMAAADAAAVGGVELEGRIVLLEEGDEPRADRPGAEHRHLRNPPFAQPLIPFGEEAELIVGAIDEAVVADRDDRGGDRQGVEIALADGLEQALQDRLERSRHAGRRRMAPGRRFAPRARLSTLHGGRDRGTGLTHR